MHNVPFSALMFWVGRHEVCSLLQAEVQPTLDLSAETLQWSSALAQGEERIWQVCASVCIMCRVKEG